MSGVGWGPGLDPAAFAPGSVPAATAAATEALRVAGATHGPPSVDDIPAMRTPDPERPGPLRVEPRSADAFDRTVDGPGGPVRVRVIAPPASAGAPRGCYLHLHGGGWMLGAADGQDQTLTAFARATGVVVVALDYRLAPEHPQPAAVEDCVAAVRWLAGEGARELAPDTGRVGGEGDPGGGRTVGGRGESAGAGIVVGGESAGAHVAALALIALRERDRGALDAVAGAVLSYGPYDVSMSPSARRWGDERIVINTPDLAFFAAQYAPAARQRDPDVSPLYADLRDLPPALFSVGTGDPLLDDTLFMASRWLAAGNHTELALYPGAPHEFLNLHEPISAEQDARTRMVAFVDCVLNA